MSYFKSLAQFEHKDYVLETNIKIVLVKEVMYFVRYTTLQRELFSHIVHIVNNILQMGEHGGASCN